MGELRQRTAPPSIWSKTQRKTTYPENGPEIFLAGEVRDDLLRMLFVRCNEAIPWNRLVFALKSLCGFDIREIALRLFYQRSQCLQTPRSSSQPSAETSASPADLAGEQYSSRLPAVNKILYLMFTEGYLSSHAETAIPPGACNGSDTAGCNPGGTSGRPDSGTFALLAVMHLHAARMAVARTDPGGVAPVEEQNRELWDRQGIQVGLEVWPNPHKR